jgi:PST family polysaccharide transporter
MQPLIAAFSSIHDDRERLRSAYLKASRFTMLLAAPTCIGMSLTSDMIIDVLLGSKWKEAAVYLQWLALATVLNAYYQPLHSLALATNRTDLVFRLNLLDLCSRILLVSMGLYFYSLPGVIVSRGAISLIMFIFSLLAARYLIGIKVVSEVANLWKVAAAGAAMAVFVLILRHELTGMDLNAFLALGLTAAFGAAVYIGALFLLGVQFKDYVPGAFIGSGGS